MNSLRPDFEKRGFDPTKWQRRMHRNPQEYIRQKLRTIQLYAQTIDIKTIAQTFDLSLQTIRKYITLYTKHGFDELCKPQSRERPGRLTAKQEAAFKQTLLTTIPKDHDLDGHIWTGDLMCAYLQKTCQVIYKSGIYDLLARLDFSHQKAHADYANADPHKQESFLNNLKDNLLAAGPKRAFIFFDEFSVCEKPTSYYGWAQKNTRPRYARDEKKVNDSMGS